ncbi:MAG: ergothioneine biosynthesis protein EgtB [Bacteroidota bacterium]
MLLTSKRALSLRENYQTIRQYTEQLCRPLQAEDYVSQLVVFASPPKWHLAHLTWFFEAFVLQAYKKDYKLFDQQFAYLFNSYYNNAGARIARDQRGSITRPSVAEVYAYRAYVDKEMMALMEQNDDPALRELIILGLQHEQQHQELLITDLKHTFAHNPTFPVYSKDAALAEQLLPTAKGDIHIPEGVYEIGFEGEGFCYDNELGRHKVYLHEFSISRSLVTNAEYLEFIQDGGYERFDLWLDEGWSWVQSENIQAPLYWHCLDGEWHHYTLAGLKKVKPEAPLAHISYYEAAAFAAWAGKRLPTEFEWEVASDHFKWGQRWEWTNSAYLPYPKYQKAAGAIGEYNGKFMVNQMVLRGASVATSPKHSRKTYRNFFHPPYRWQFTGIRLTQK